MKLPWTSKVLVAAAVGFFSETASAHCPISYVVTGPGGLYWQLSLDGDLYDGMLPGGTTSQLGPPTSWADTRRIGVTLGTVPISLLFTDGTHFAVCPPVMLNLTGPPRCSEDMNASGEVNHPLCIPYFTVVQTAPGVYSCSSTCQVGTFPVPEAYSPPASTPPALSEIAPRSSKAAAAAIALSVSGSGFVGGAVVVWNGSPLSTTLLNNGSVVALVPSALLALPGTANVTVAIPGSVSAPLTFTVSP
jgi:hypothetical protein